MPRTSSRKRNNNRNDNTHRIPIASSLSPNAQEFVPTTNNEASALEREYLATQPMTINGTFSASTSTGIGNYPEASNYPIPNLSTNICQRDLLINGLNEGKIDCVVCYERIKNVESIWNCRSCFQIMHLKCIMIWFIKSNIDATWRCPACQNNFVGKPSYVCFCGSAARPLTNNQDTPHSCGQVCGLHKKNSNLDYDNCHHKCTLLCHPGPCPQCVVQVLRDCKCGKTKVYAQCGQSAPILCENICAKQLNCKNHVCEKLCHVETCGPCKKDCPQSKEESSEISDLYPSNVIHHFTNNPTQAHISAEELEMLDLNPDELLQLNNYEDAIDNINVFYDEDLHYGDDFGEPSPLFNTLSFTRLFPSTITRSQDFINYLEDSSTESLNSVSTLDSDSITTFITVNNVNNSSEIRNNTMENDSIEENEIQILQTDSDGSEIAWMGSSPSSDGEDDCSNNSISSSSYHTSTTESISTQSEDHSDGFAQTIISYFNDSNSYSVCNDSDTSSSL